jgi:pyruvate formate lyase activating enzyme
VLACKQGAVQLVKEVPVTDRDLCLLNGDCVEECAADARQIAGQEMSVGEVLEEIQRDLPFYESSGGGVTFSGGEPLSQVEFLVEVLKACKKVELHTSLDTSGYAPWSKMDMIREYVDLFLYDLKFVDEKQHLRYTGVSNQEILENLEKLSREGHQIVVRVPLIPGITDTKENIQAIGVLVSGLGNIKRVDLLPYHTSAEGKYNRLGLEYKLAGKVSPDETQVLKLAETLKGFGLPVNVGG